MIRKATLRDIPQIRTLWSISFEDEPSFVNHFLTSIGIPDRCLVYESDGEIVSMLFLLPGEIVANGVLRDMRYVYACATLPEQKGRGYMRALLDQAFADAKRDSIFALTILPANERLLLFYEKAGFQRLFRRPVFDKAVCGSLQSSEALDRLMCLRAQCLTGELTVHWPKEHLEFVLSDLLENGGRVFLSENGYCIFEHEGDEFPKEQMPLICNMAEWSEDYALIRFCEDYTIPEGISAYFNLGLD